MTFPRLHAIWLMLRGHMVKPDPTVPPVDRPGDVHSRKVHLPGDNEWLCGVAGEVWAEGDVDVAANCIIAATGNGEARIVEDGT